MVVFKYLNLFNKTSVLFVCTGNLCRSPTAQIVFEHLVAQAGLRRKLLIASAGTHVSHRGEPADARAIQAASRRGYDMRALRTRRLQKSDYARFDYLLAMDEKNLAHLQRDCPADHSAKLSLFMTYSSAGKPIPIPDPYFGAPQGFERVIDMVEDAARGLLRHIRLHQSL